MVFVLVVGMIFFVFNGFHYYDERSWRFRTFVEISFTFLPASWRFQVLESEQCRRRETAAN